MYVLEIQKYKRGHLERRLGQCYDGNGIGKRSACACRSFISAWGLSD